MKFNHRVSKGSKFNQIYIPNAFCNSFEVGDLVEVKLLKKKTQLYYSDNLKHLSKFKENILKSTFSVLNQIKDVSQVYVFGSFLTKTVDYRDIDILLVTDNATLEELAFNKLTKELNLKFHIISVNEDKLNHLIKICPLVRSMFYYCISNKEVIRLPQQEIEKNHIMFLLMMPEDILTTNLSSKYFYDSLRRLVTIEQFLKGKGLDPKLINELLENALDKSLIKALMNNELLNKKEISDLRWRINEKLNYIKKRL